MNTLREMQSDTTTTVILIPFSSGLNSQILAQGGVI